MIIAHRGGALLGTENSLSCIEKGIATGADMVEVDLHLTADRQIVVCHDRKVNRTTNGKGKIEEMMETAVDAYDKQLDYLYKDEALDISTDITVMENLMKSEGLTEK